MRVFRHDRPRPLVFDPHLHSEHEFVLVESGRGVAYARDETLPFEAGDLLAFAGSLPHTVVTEPGTRRSETVVVHVAARAALPGDDRVSAYGGLFSHARHAVRFRPTRRSGQHALHSAVHDLLAADDLRARDRLHRLCERLTSSPAEELDCSVLSLGAVTPAILRVVACLRAENGQQRSLDELAHVAAMRPDSLCRAFRRCFDRTISDFRNELRVERAAQALSTTERSILSIALDAGYENLSYFNRRFRRRFGVTPREYRRAQSMGGASSRRVG